MKKIISVLLCFAILFSATAVAVSAAESDLKVIVANDLHLSAKAYSPYTGNTASNAYAHVPSSGQLIVESNAIITAFLENAANSDAKAILVPGDLVDTGAQEEHLLLAAKFADFENTTGKSVYVIPGNHDLFKTSVDTFKTIYADFGFNDAIATDSASAAYVADLDDNYRLIAIDSTRPGESVHGVTAEDITWIKAQLEQAAADGKYVIAMMHHNLVEHFIFGETIHKGAVVNEEIGLSELLASNGVKYIFTGHTHDQDIASYTASNGNVIYDVVTNTLNAYPCAYREVTFGEEVKFEAKKVDKIDTSLLPLGLSDEAVALAGSDFTEYTKTCIWTGLRKTFTSYLNAAALINLIGLDKEADAEMCAIITKVGDKLSEVVQMPFYKADAEDGKSFEEIAAKYGKTLPASNYTDLIDLAITLYQAHCIGDENYAANSTEIQLLITAVSTVLAYCLEDVSAEEYTAVLKFALSFTESSVPDNLLDFAGSSIARVQGIDLIVSLVLRPLVAQFTTDDSPADNNVTLPGYGEQSSFKQFIQMIRDFFTKIIEFFKMMFSFIPMPA